MRVDFKPSNICINNKIKVSPDKSITHRAIMLGSIAKGLTTVYNYLDSEDCLATLSIMKQLGVTIEQTDKRLLIHGKGLNSLCEPKTVLDAKNSGTTMRLLSGILAGQKFMSVITGDKSLNKRPMKRIINPLQSIGANVYGRESNKYAPICILPASKLTSNEHFPSVASAQVKSCLLFAGLYAHGVTVVNELAKTRDHSERMLAAMGAKVEVDNSKISILGNSNLNATEIFVPGDFSTAAYFIALALCVPNSKLIIKSVGVNETRIGLINVLVKMGAKIKLDNKVTKNNENSADIVVEYSSLKAVEVSEQDIATLIDEVPLLAVIASHAQGETKIMGVEELKHKESDRLSAIITELIKTGIELNTDGKNLYIKGKNQLAKDKNYTFNHYNDHRIAMSMAICALTHNLNASIHGAEIVNISSPSFWSTLLDIMPKEVMEVCVSNEY